VLMFVPLWEATATLVHELGHAVFALADSEGRVVVCIGTGDGLRFSMGRLSLDLSPVGGGICLSSPETLIGHALGIVAGPLASLALAGLLYVLMKGYPSLEIFFGVGAVVSAIHFAGSIVPWRHEYLGSSDGWEFAAVLLGRESGNGISD